MGRRKPAVTLADVERTLAHHLAVGTVEKFDDGTYALVPRERLSPAQLRWLAAQTAREDAWLLRHSDPRGTA
jgi:hypothetical protein